MAVMVPISPGEVRYIKARSVEAVDRLEELLNDHSRELRKVLDELHEARERIKDLERDNEQLETDLKEAEERA